MIVLVGLLPTSALAEEAPAQPVEGAPAEGEVDSPEVEAPPETPWPEEASPPEAPPAEEAAPPAPAEEPEATGGLTEVEPRLAQEEQPVVSAPVEALPGSTVVEPTLASPTQPEEPAQPAEGEDVAAGLSRQGGEQVWSNALPFRGTSLIYENIFNAYQLNRGNDQTYNPYYAMSLSIRPRWYFTDRLSARLRFDLEGELTDADDTTNYHETIVSDLFFDLVYNPIFTIPALDIDVGLGLRFQFPTSLQSQAETRFLGLGGVINLSRVFDVLDGLTIGYSFRYTKYLNRYTTLERESNPYICSIDQSECLANSQLGDPARSHGFVNAIDLSLDFLEERFRLMTLSFSVLFYNNLSYEVPEASVPLMGGELVTVDHIENPQRHTAAVWYVVDLSILITDYLSLSIGTSTLTPQLRPDSTYRTPFFNRFTNVYIDLSLDIERLVAAVRR